MPVGCKIKYCRTAILACKKPKGILKNHLVSIQVSNTKLSHNVNYLSVFKSVSLEVDRNACTDYTQTTRVFSSRAMGCLGVRPTDLRPGAEATRNRNRKPRLKRLYSHSTRYRLNRLFVAQPKTISYSVNSYPICDCPRSERPSFASSHNRSCVNRSHIWCDFRGGEESIWHNGL